MLQIRSHLDVADNTGAKIAWAIGVLGRNQRYARVGDVIKVHIKDAAPDGQVKKGERHAHFRAGGAGVARQEVYEDCFAGAGGDLRLCQNFM
jgi:hypothetical protein